MNKIRTAEIYGMYCKDYDITFIVKDVFDDNGNRMTLEVTGFYHGEPNEDANREYYGKYKAEYNKGDN